jgi:hypothetical protein
MTSRASSFLRIRAQLRGFVVALRATAVAHRLKKILHKKMHLVKGLAAPYDKMHNFVYYLSAAVAFRYFVLILPILMRRAQNPADTEGTK